MTDLTGTTWEELHTIAYMWGFGIDAQIRPNGYVEAALLYGKLKYSTQRYGSERAAINDLLSMLRNQIDIVIENIENGS